MSRYSKVIDRMDRQTDARTDSMKTLSSRTHIIERHLASLMALQKKMSCTVCSNTIYLQTSPVDFFIVIVCNSPFHIRCKNIIMNLSNPDNEQDAYIVG